MRATPMKQFKFVGVVVMLFVFVLTGCKKEDGSPSDTGGGTGGQASSVPTLSSFGGTTPVNVLAVVRTSTEVTVAGFTVFNDATVGAGVFGNPGQDKGDVNVRVSSTDYPFTKNTVSGSVSYTYAPSATNLSGIPLNIGATDVVFGASGYALSPAAVTVPGQLKLTAPAANATVPRSANLTVSWTVTNAGAHSAVFITDYAGHAKFYENLSGTSYAIPTADLQTLMEGRG